MSPKTIIGTFAVISQIIALLAYIPQYRHLIRVKDSTGMSVTTWVMWIIANVLLLMYAITIRDIVFITILVFTLIADSTVLFMTLKYRKRQANN